MAKIEAWLKEAGGDMREDNPTVEEVLFDVPGGSKPQGVIYANADAMLAAVHAIGFEEERGEMQDHHCRFCDAWIDTRRDGTPYETHADDCLFFQIEEYLKEIGRI